MLLIAKREYLEQIRGRAFRISTVLVPAASRLSSRRQRLHRPQDGHGPPHRHRRRQRRPRRRYPRQSPRRQARRSTPSTPLLPSPAQDRARSSRARRRTNPSTACSSSTTPPPATPTRHLHLAILRRPDGHLAPRATPSTTASSICASRSRAFRPTRFTPSSKPSPLKPCRSRAAAKPARARA